MLKTNLKYLILVVLICSMTGSIFAHQDNLTNTPSKLIVQRSINNDNSLSSQSDLNSSLNHLVLKGSKKLFWSSSDNLFLSEINKTNNGPVIGLAYYAFCRAMGASVSTCVAACTVATIVTPEMP